MCTLSIEKPNIKIADNNIITYKLVNYVKPKNIFKRLFQKYIITSFVRNFEYKLNRIYTCKLDLPKQLKYIYSSESAKQLKYIYSSESAFYSYKDSYGTNAKCIIPKGSYYFIARDIDSGEEIYHSNKIKIIEIF